MVNGRKRHIAASAKPKVCADTQGLLLGVPAPAASTQDANGAGDLPRRVKPPCCWLRAVFADGIHNRVAAVKVLRRHVDEERRWLGPHGRTLADFMRTGAAGLAGDPLFLTSAGTAFDPDHFRRDFWTPALREAGISLRCHQVRHWFVAQALSAIHAEARSEAQLVRDREAFRELMAWKSDMLPVYDQAVRRHDLPGTAVRVHAWIDREGSRARDREGAVTASNTSRPMCPVPSEAATLLKDMLGGGEAP